MRKIIGLLGIVLIAVVFICIPFPAGDLHIRLYFDDITGERCTLYYTTDMAPDFSEDKSVSVLIGEDGMVDFCLESSLAGHITCLRIDWPELEQLICVKTVTVSSAGIIQAEYDPTVFFDQSHIAYESGIADKSMVSIKKRAYIKTTEDDPYMILDGGLTNRIQDCYSHFRLTRVAVFIFVFGCIFSYKKNFFEA